MDQKMKSLLLCVAIFLLVGSRTTVAQQVIQGDVKVGGTISANSIQATSIQASGAAVLTTKDIAAIQAQVLKQVAEEITTRLRFNGNSPEMRAFSEQVTSAVAKTIGVSNQDLATLRRDLNDSNRAGAASINEMRTALGNLQRAHTAAEREIATLRREIDQLRRDLNRR